MDKYSERWKKWFSKGQSPSTDDVGNQPDASAVAVNHDENVALEAEHEANLMGEESSDELKMPQSYSGENESPRATLVAAGVSATDLSPKPGSTKRYEHPELKGMSDAELLQVLRQSWGCSGNKLEVWGQLTVAGFADKQFVKLSEVRSVRDNAFLSYPCEVAHPLKDRGIYIPSTYGWDLVESGHKFIRCELELSPHNHREKHGNPLAVTVKPGSAIPLKKIPVSISEQLISTEDATLISELVYEHYLGLKKRELGELESKLKAEIETNVETAKRALIEVLSAQKEAQAEMAKARNDHVQVEQENARLKEAISQLQYRQTEEAEKLVLLQATHEKAEKKMSQYLERLKHYIDDKATILKQLEFIDAEEFELLFGDRRDSKRDEGRLSFGQDLGGDYAVGVSYIQAYLLERDILYPRHVLENFFALLRTHDLIVLAGDSGSGKTNLVQSVAAAIGGVAKIIPVKPNWTSSEDLLGYYNPLEKKYLATPFLEALIEANKNPDVPYLICLDEMNLARVEYYFADFLSKLEQRNGAPEVELFSDNESAHVLSELRQVMEIIRGAKDKYQKEDVVTFVKLLQDEEINAELRRAFGFSDKDSLIKYHSDIRRMLAGVLNTPSSLRFPPNVRIIGAINIDETTHYLSPKILDRAHVMKFKSPLLTDWQSIIDQVTSYGFGDVSKPLQVDLDDLGQRVPYPKFDQDHPFCRRFVELNREYFHPMGVEFGLRAIRQGLNYLNIFSEFNDDVDLAINNFVLHKVLPKLTFDGNKEAAGVTKLDLLFGLAANLNNALELDESLDDEFSVKKALPLIANKAKANDGIVNYWA
ncbi:hypothetical protein ebA4601 [Aromatoleum aromaticum EbN1]|uniref:ATPase dynein-related AAA domain-containing protein n=1 Tax=Aromatoleum aromaticum (strain DSM 19018 / LMG 30748 / EbN1) TaxID=76114 RepID=Q5P1T3_AROAE|nr:AAA family ATPase [Aromatoleum aromaticum]CAI08731.1 hypothetical protein ebA4601 [Aromatoleum aromaticum EbN1]